MKMLDKIADLTAQLELLRLMLEENKELFAGFSQGNSTITVHGIHENTVSLYLHDPFLHQTTIEEREQFTVTAKAFVKAAGGKWERERNSRGSFDYHGKWGRFEVVIFDAENLPKGEEVIL